MTTCDWKTGCARHRKYQLSCDAFAALIARADGRCEVCGSEGPLYIEHDHSIGDHAVRGLVCHTCNQRLDWFDKGMAIATEDQMRYLEAAFWKSVEHPEPYEIRWSPRGAAGRRFSISDELWVALRMRASRRESVGAVVRRALEEYVK